MYTMKKVSVIVPMYYEEEVAEECYKRLKRVLERINNYNYEIIFINDGSKDKTLSILLDMASKDKNVKIISAMGMGNKLDPTQIEVSDISKTSVCPLAKTIRKQLRAKGINHSKVVYSRELPNRFDKSEEHRRTTASISFVPSVGGLIIASQIVRDLIDEF